MNLTMNAPGSKSSTLERILEPEVMDCRVEAAAYDAMDHTEPNEAFVERLMALGARGRMLDIGTGPGHIPLLVAQRQAGATIMAVDASRCMLELARARLALSPRACRVTMQRCDAKCLPFIDRCFDAVFSNTLVHHLPDARPMLREAARVLRPGGVLLIRDLYRPADEDELDRLVNLYAPAHDDETKIHQQLFRDSLLASLTPDELRSAAADAGIGDAQVVIDTDRHMSLQTNKFQPH